jgi:hypothetical protein
MNFTKLLGFYQAPGVICFPLHGADKGGEVETHVRQRIKGRSAAFSRWERRGSGVAAQPSTRGVFFDVYFDVTG